MRKLFIKLFWKSRKINLVFSLLTILINKQEEWGFKFFTICYNYKSYSLLSLTFALPNFTTRKKIYIISFDIFFLLRFLEKRWDLLTDKELWDHATLKERIELKLYRKLFKW